MSVEKIPCLARHLGIPPEKIALLQEALTHRTYAVEHHLDYDNQRLEFLGDAVLEIILTEQLFVSCPDLPEGDLTKIRSALACESALANIARRLELGSYLLIGNGEKECGGYNRDSTLCDLFEAVLGALYLACGMKRTADQVISLFKAELADPKRLLLSLNPKGRLQEYSQSKWKRTPEYRLFRSGGPQHSPFFEVEVRIDRFCAMGYGNSRKNAEINAAAAMVKFLTK